MPKSETADAGTVAEPMDRWPKLSLTVEYWPIAKQAAHRTEDHFVAARRDRASRLQQSDGAGSPRQLFPVPLAVQPQPS